MFDVGWQELMLIGVVALVVVGPKDLPLALRTGAKWVRKARGLAREFQTGVNEVIREAELEEIKEQVKKQVEEVQAFDPAKEAEKFLDPDSELARELRLMDGSAGMDDPKPAATEEAAGPLPPPAGNAAPKADG
ncbi:MAG: Sec-independent protein translocase protein TatB [Magnetospirillum sp. WYHS-4]